MEVYTHTAQKKEKRYFPKIFKRPAIKKTYIVLSIFLLTCPCIAQNKYVDSLRTALTATTKSAERFDLLNKLGEALFSGSSVSVDSAFCLQLLSIAQDLKNDSLLAISYNWLGNYFSWTSNFNKALEYFLKGVPLAEKAKDMRRLSSLYLDISIVFSSINNPAEELKYINLARINLPDKNSPAFPFMNIQVKGLLAKYYLLHGKPDSALHYAQAVKEINLNLKSMFFEAASNVFSGAVYEQVGDTALADIFYKKAVVIEDSNGRFYPWNSPKKMYTEFLLRHNQILPAKALAFQCLAISRDIKNNELSLASAGYLQDIYHRIKQPDSAYYFSRLETRLRDSVFGQQKINQLQSMAFSEQLRMRDEELKNRKEEEERKRQIQYLFISIGIIAVILLFLMLSHSIIVNEPVIKFIGIIGLLVFFEFINLLIHPVLEKITHHSPVIMLLILVCIAALLIPLHHKLEKWITHKMVEKNKRIRLAAAKRTVEKLEPIKPTND
jgi:tetratricopeptide (TPR) repeat protein